MGSKKPTAQAIPSEKEIEASAYPEEHGHSHRVILGFDISSSCVGWAVYCDRDLVKYGKYVFKTTAEIGEKLLAFESFFEVLLDTYDPKVIVYEKPLSARRINNARSVEMVGVLRKVWRERSGGEIKNSWIITARTVKNRLNVPRGRNHDHNKKIMVEKINRMYGLSLKYDPNSKYKSDDDVADAIAVVVAYLRLEPPIDE